MSKYTRVTVNLPEEAVTFLKMRALLFKTSVTQVLNAALGNYKYLNDKVAQGGTILTLEPDGSMRQVTLP